jgi:hypothetical protein
MADNGMITTPGTPRSARRDADGRAVERRVMTYLEKLISVAAARQDDEPVVQQVLLGGRTGADPAGRTEERLQVGGDVVRRRGAEPDDLEQRAHEHRGEGLVDDDAEWSTSGMYLPIEYGKIASGLCSSEL